MRTLAGALVAILLLTLALRSNAQITGRYMRLEGTVAGKAVVMHLVTSQGNAHGFYYYRRVGQPIPLIAYYGEAGPSADSIVLAEWTSGINQSGTMKLAKGHDSLITGAWMNPDSTQRLPVRLVEQYPIGSVRLDVLSCIDSLVRRYHGGNLSTLSSVELVAPFSHSTTSATFLFETIGHTLNCDGKDGDALCACAQQTIHSNNDSAIAELTQEIAGNGDSVGENIYMYQWSHLLQVSPRYNDHEVLSLDCFEEIYTGGAHPTHETTELVCDLRTNRPLKLGDITTANKLLLSALLGASVRKQFHLRHSQPLSDILFEDRIEPSSNFYITDRGIGFLYAPYEVAPYALGELDLFIPFTALKGKLTAWTTERFGAK